MWWVPIAVAGAQMGMGLYQGQQGKKAARKTASGQADAYLASANEELRRLKKNQSYNMGETYSRMAASGVLNEGSSLNYAENINQEQKEQYRWQFRTSRLNRDAILAGGQAQGDAVFKSSVFQGISAGTNTIYGYWASQQAPGGGG